MEVDDEKKNNYNILGMRTVSSYRHNDICCRQRQETI